MFLKLLIFCLSFFTIVSGSLTDDIIAGIRDTSDCSDCLSLLVSLQQLALLGDASFVELLDEICIAEGADDPDVCTGFLASTGPIIAHDLRSINVSITGDGTAPNRLCDAVFGFCASSFVNPFTVPLPPRTKSPKTVTNNEKREIFRMAHISDVHIDREYTVGTEANCTKSICCRNFDNSTSTPDIPAGPNGNSKCDSPVSLADSLLEAVRRSDSKFVIFTGDVVEGAVWLIDETEVTADLSDFDSQLASKLKLPVFPSLGNHDSFPVNSFQRDTTGNDTQWVFDTQSAGWEQFVGAKASQQVKHHSGSYAANVEGTNLKILAINTQYWYKQNLWLYDSDTFQPDPNGVLAFMVQQLQAAEDAGQHVFIEGHIPLGKEDTMEDQSNYYDQILQRYKDTIAGQFFGHSHKDQFEIAYSNYAEQTAANAVGVAHIGPALTPTSGNPAFKIYDVDAKTFEIMDVHVIFTNVSDSFFQSEPVWKEYYSARETYGPLVGLKDNEPLSPAFWHNLTEVFSVNETAFAGFNERISRGGAVTACDDSCRTTTICDMRAFRSENNCDGSSGGIGVREPGRHVLESECEGKRFVDIMLEISTNLKQNK
ncbi:sphingomyelin phosphodiesterase [Mycena floridula]|nr:sphingomyelin phosphodiesterase [Mycena floridula]